MPLYSMAGEVGGCSEVPSGSRHSSHISWLYYSGSNRWFPKAQRRGHQPQFLQSRRASFSSRTAEIDPIGNVAIRPEYISAIFFHRTLPTTWHQHVVRQSWLSAREPPT